MAAQTHGQLAACVLQLTHPDAFRHPADQARVRHHCHRQPHELVLGGVHLALRCQLQHAALSDGGAAKHCCLRPQPPQMQLRLDADLPKPQQQQLKGHPQGVAHPLGEGRAAVCICKRWVAAGQAGGMIGSMKYVLATAARQPGSCVD
jgi:hypothetical protein